MFLNSTKLYKQLLYSKIFMLKILNSIKYKIFQILFKMPFNGVYAPVFSIIYFRENVSASDTIFLNLVIYILSTIPFSKDCLYT